MQTAIKRNNMTPTKRIYTDVETGYQCRLYTSNDNSKFHLIYEGQPDKIADGNEVNGYYLSAHTGTTIRINCKKEIFVSSGQFYNLKEGEKITHRKFIGFPRFAKI